MLLGDNLSDFSSAFDIQENDSRNNLVDSLNHHFGNKFLVFPNPIYGNWEKDGLFDGHYKWNRMQKDSIRHSRVKSF